MLAEMPGSFLDGLKLVKNFRGHGCHHLYRSDIHLSHILKPVSGTKPASWCCLSSGNAPPNNAGNCRKKTFQWRPWPSPGFSESSPGITVPNALGDDLISAPCQRLIRRDRTLEVVGSTQGIRQISSSVASCCPALARLPRTR